MKDRIKETIKVKWRELEWFQPEELKTPDNLAKLKTSLKKNGMLDAFKLWRRRGKLLILDGHMRQKAMLELEAEDEQIPDVFTANVLDVKNEREAKKVVMACNSHYARINGDAMLDFIGGDFSLDELNAEFEIPGFDFAGLDSEEIEEDEIPETPKNAICKKGQLWQLGMHRLLCGDATSADDVARLMDGKKAFIMVTDQPYGVNYDAGWREQYDKVKRHSTDPVTNDDTLDWSVVYPLFDSDIIYVWCASNFASEVSAGLKNSNYEIRYLLIWAKQAFVFGRGSYHWQHEPCWYAVKKGSKAKWKGGRKQSTL